ncbi:thymine dioxygenase [Phlegmacium glaucopus]|nr:thymine dioxygenase [Phlegmacium glaucopus]
MDSNNLQSSSSTTVKVVDFAPFLNGSDKQGVSNAILDSFKTIGFVYLVNHGLPQSKIDSMFSWSKKLFSQPMEVKQLAPHPVTAYHQRGYSAPGREKVYHLKPDKDGKEEENTDTTTNAEETEVQKDIKESFEVGREDDPVMPNIWYPDGVLPGFKDASLDFFWTCYDTEKQILKALALGFNLSEDYFLSFHTKADNELRLLHYPSVPASVLENEKASRIPSHADFCTLTILVQDDVGGLEVEDPHRPGTFVPVPPIPGSIVVNAGDFLMIWSNDTIRSTVHRVRSPTKKGDIIPARYSIPYDLSTIVDCIPGTWDADRPKLYPPISAGEYILKRLSLNY